MITDTLKNAIYTVGINSDEPIMFIDTHIGYDSEDGMGIDGSIFARELMELDQLGKKCINVWINSVGGSIIDGQKIYSAILNSKTKVNTYNMGVCLSIAASIFQAGRKRCMADYSKLMLHPVQNVNDQKALNAFTDSVVTMLSRRTNKTESDVKTMMNMTTWLNASECLEMGLCDEVVNSSDINKPRLQNIATNDYVACKHIMNKAKEEFSINNNKQMKKVANHFKLNADSNEDAIFEAVVASENKLKSDVETATNKYNAELVKSTNLANELTSMKNKFDAMEAENKARIETENANKATVAVAELVKAGKIANTDEAKNEWTELFKVAPEQTAKLAATLTVTKDGNRIDTVTNKVSDLGAGASMAAAMLEIQNKNKAK